MYDGAAIECARSALPQFVNAQQSAPAHTSSFSYGFPVPYSCPAGIRFEDGRTNMMVTCSDYGWAWPAVVTLCACESLTCALLIQKYQRFIRNFLHFLRFLRVMQNKFLISRTCLYLRGFDTFDFCVICYFTYYY